MISLSLVLLALCALVALAMICVGMFFVLVKLGVIVRESSRPRYKDYSDYSLDQGREVRPEDERR